MTVTHDLNNQEDLHTNGASPASLVSLATEPAMIDGEEYLVVPDNMPMATEGDRDEDVRPAIDSLAAEEIRNAFRVAPVRVTIAPTVAVDVEVHMDRLTYAHLGMIRTMNDNAKSDEDREAALFDVLSVITDVDMRKQPMRVFNAVLETFQNAMDALGDTKN